jgi:hypothetical protein
MSEIPHNELEELIPVENNRECISLNFQSIDRFNIASVNTDNQSLLKIIDGRSL